MSTPRSSLIPAIGLFACLIVVAGCSALGGHPRPLAAARAVTTGAEPAAATSSAAGVHAVLAFGGRAFVLVAETPRPETRAERVVVPGGWALELQPLADDRTRAFTVVGPHGRCVARARGAFALALDLGGYSGAALPGPSHAALELRDCVEHAAS